MEQGRFQSTKVLDGYSTCFRQWPAESTHCRFLHGYGITVKVVFEGNLDERNWVVDFGGLRRAEKKIDGKSPKEWLNWLLDHTTIIAADDPAIGEFRTLETLGVLQLRILPSVGAEKFAEHIGSALDFWVHEETNGRCRLVSCEVREHERNSAIYYPPQ